MRKAVAALIVMAPLLAACGAEEELSFLPELNGRWAPPNAAVAADRMRVSIGNPPPRDDKSVCKLMHVSFGKEVAVKTMGYSFSVFSARGATREGDRIVFTGKASEDSRGGDQGRLVMQIRDNQLRFDNVYDGTGRSMAHERLHDSHPMRKHGASTVGDAMRLFLDVKRCPA